MTFETCPLLDEILWIKHGFYDEAESNLDTVNPKEMYFSHNFPRALFLKQTHSDKICFDIDNRHDEADASITSQSGLALVIKTADCCPIFLVCKDTQDIAAIHAGWLGAANRITAKTVDKLIQTGAKPENIIAAIGPSIRQETYTVDDNRRDFVLANQPEMQRYFIPYKNEWKMDVAGIVKQQLIDAGVQKIWQSPINTFTDPRYASYRRDKTTLRNISIIAKSDL